MSELVELIRDKTAYGVGGFFDVETTGLSPDSEEIVELCLVLFVFNRLSGEIIGILDSYVGLNEPSKKIGKSAQKVHGITDAMVKGHRIDVDRVQTLMEIADFFVAHNASFDRGFLQKYLVFPKTKKWYCSMNGIDWRGKGHSSKGLQNLLNGHGLAPQNHRADGDVMAAIQLLSQTDSKGNYYLFELLSIDRRKRPTQERQTRPQIALELRMHNTQAASEVAATSIPHQYIVRNAVYVDGKNKVVMYILWFFTGIVGGHRYYLRDYWRGVFMTLTFSFYGIWTLVDLFFIGKRFEQKFRIR